MNTVSAPGAPPIDRLKIGHLQDWPPPSTPPNLLDHSLQVHVQSRSITASECISQFTQLWPPSASPDSLNHGLQVSLQTCSITPSKCISRLARSRPGSLRQRVLQIHLQTHSITISECISNFTRSGPPSVSPTTLDYRLQVRLYTCSITALECISEFAWRSLSGTPQIALKHCLQPVQIYPVVDG